MCNNCSEHAHDHHHHPEIVQIMPVQQPLYAVYHGQAPLEYAVENGLGGLSLVPVLFLGLIKHGEKSMVEGFFASNSVQSCEDIEGFKGYASSLSDAEKLYNKD
ncbi:hypothetical protein SAMN02746065_103172 [Desulfocicer vacuolatum DSM 3385]|uniref:Uncharacterized protein n=1 Tax=Desulfocicer vacuolatum DSM 3385 TaxID=1121400 RepID=A0A1W1ZU91_9BACT|nr:hypothetical protein [Desulfocicer vacuolatum]SMC51681.1 hypothetical protein SAMN02746065_103172 [Desulfocicer vacuolatum DSM 3385]